MTHVELLMAERAKYVKEGIANLDLAAELLHLNVDSWDKKHEDMYVDFVQKSANNLNKAIAINDVLIKLGVLNS